MAAKGAQAYVYDALNRMTQATSKESYLYDGHGRRVQITKTSDGKLNYPIYSLDGKLLLEDNRQTSKRTEYIYAGGRLVAKRIQPITSTGANNGAATTTTVHTDFLGSPVAETNSAGTVTRVERYTPYGEPADMALDVGPGFTGHATDVATGLTYMQQRYYDAEIGRFLTPDPVGPEEDFVNHFNRYNYAQNNPVRNVDMDGAAPTPNTCGKAGGGSCSGVGPGTSGNAGVETNNATKAKSVPGSSQKDKKVVINGSAPTGTQSPDIDWIGVFVAVVDAGLSIGEGAAGLGETIISASLGSEEGVALGIGVMGLSVLNGLDSTIAGNNAFNGTNYESAHEAIGRFFNGEEGAKAGAFLSNYMTLSGWRRSAGKMAARTAKLDEFLEFETGLVNGTRAVDTEVQRLEKDK